LREATLLVAVVLGLDDGEVIMQKRQILNCSLLSPPNLPAPVYADGWHTKESTSGIMASSLLLTADAPWSDLISLQLNRTLPGTWFEHSYRGYRIALRRNRSTRIQFKLLGDRIQDETFVPGDFCLLSPGVIERLRLRDPGETLIATISPLFIRELALGIAGKDCLEIPNAHRLQDTQIEYMLLALEAELKHSCPGGRLYGESIATALAVHMIRRYGRVQDSISNRLDGLPVAMLRRIVEFIQQHLEEDIGLQRLADLVNMSPYYFARMFKQSTGMTPHRYLMRQRIDRAKELLANRQFGVAEVAYSVGFASQSHFTVAFSRLVGITPGAYRRQV
jgi:AraC family transcriptional regulator